MLWDEGYWTPQTDIEKGLRGGSLKFMLQGKRLKGNWTLVRMAPKNGETADNWLLIKEKTILHKAAAESAHTIQASERTHNGRDRSAGQ
jgi:bifunctional non-homologous end joining protein LigD